MELKLLEVPLRSMGKSFSFGFEEQVQAKQTFLQRSEYSPVHSNNASSLGMFFQTFCGDDQMVSRFLGFSVSPSGSWSLGDAGFDSGEDRRLQGGCAQL